MSMKNSSRLGQAYKFSDISELDQEIWIVFASSQRNEEILRLAPAFTERRTADSVPVVSGQAGQRWMVPGVEIAIHSLDLTPDRMASDDAFTVRRSADEDSVPVSTGLEDEEKLLARLSQVTMAIEVNLHNSDVVSVPSLADCVLESIDPAAPAVTFVWAPDRQRAYQAQKVAGHWLLSQQYRDPLAIPEDKQVPLMAGNGLVSFNSSGSAQLKSEHRSAIGLQFGEVVSNLLRDNEPVVGAGRGLLTRLIEAVFLPWKNPGAGAGLVPARGAGTRAAGNDGRPAQTGEQKHRFIRKIVSPAKIEDGLTINWDIPAEDRKRFKSWSVEAWAQTQDGTLKRIPAEFSVLPNDEVDPSKVLFEPIDLVHVTRDGDHGIYIECMEYEDNIWHVRITLDVTRPSEAA
jgi:hypothetical protein